MHVPVLIIIALIGLLFWPWYVSLGIFVAGLIAGEIHSAFWVPPMLRKPRGAPPKT